MIPFRKARGKRPYEEIIESLSKTINNPWPKHFFHFTDITNVPKILASGHLCSRNYLKGKGEKFTDGASKGVIGQTSDWKMDYARLYFRPLNPTQHNNEGFRPSYGMERDSHCPAPAFLIFNALKVLKTPGVKFTEGNFGASRSKLLEGEEEYDKLPFKLIYSEGKYGNFREVSVRELTYHRCAEIMKKDYFNLDALQFIACRSPAEKTTLLNLLSPELYGEWARKILYNPRNPLFFSKWAYIEEVDLVGNQIVVSFNKTLSRIGPFEIDIKIQRPIMGTEVTTNLPRRIYDNHLHLHASILNGIIKNEDVRVQIYLDKNLAYNGVLTQYEI